MARWVADPAEAGRQGGRRRTSVLPPALRSCRWQDRKVNRERRLSRSRASPGFSVATCSVSPEPRLREGGKKALGHRTPHREKMSVRLSWGFEESPRDGLVGHSVRVSVRVSECLSDSSLSEPPEVGCCLVAGELDEDAAVPPEGLVDGVLLEVQFHGEAGDGLGTV